MKTINATDFKAKCLALFDLIQRQGEVFIILKRGKPVAEVRPVVSFDKQFPQHRLQGTIKILGDVISPVLSDEEIELRIPEGGEK